jgi:hypothetical protein
LTRTPEDSSPDYFIEARQSACGARRMWARARRSLEMFSGADGVRGTAAGAQNRSSRSPAAIGGNPELLSQARQAHVATTTLSSRVSDIEPDHGERRLGVINDRLGPSFHNHQRRDRRRHRVNEPHLEVPQGKPINARFRRRTGYSHPHVHTPTLLGRRPGRVMSIRSSVQPVGRADLDVTTACANMKPARNRRNDCSFSFREGSGVPN